MLTVNQIEAVASLLPADTGRKPGRPLKVPLVPIDVPSWVEEHLGHISITERKERDGVSLYILSECPFDPQHKAPDSIIGQMSSGAVFFKCFHNSCQSYGWRELRERFDPKGGYEGYEGKTSQSTPKKSPEEIQASIEKFSEVTGLPTIEVNDSQLRDVAVEVIRAIDAAGKNNATGKPEPLLYVRGDGLARIVVDSDKHPRPGIVGAEAMPEIMSRAANFVRTSFSGCVGVFPPENLAKAIVNIGQWSFPVLRGIVEIPVLRKDGTILDSPGYDTASELYYRPNTEIPKIPDNPGKRDAESATAFLLDILSDFPFQDDASRDNALGLLLTVVVREIVGLAPMALIDAPTKGTGKTRLAQLVSIVATGRELPLSPEVRDDEEWRKQITSLLIADRLVIVIDNVERTLCSGHLAAVLTTSEWADRLLGKSEVLHLHSRAIWIATGNNIRLGGDISRRAYWIRLNSNLAKPWMRDSREFKRELPFWAITHRAEIVAALLTMARAWIVGGRPAWSGRSLGSYEAWSQTVGGILEYCGLTKFLSNLEALYEQVDDEPAQWGVFFEAIFEVFGENNCFSTKTLIERVSEESGHFLASEENNSLKSSLPERLGEVSDKGFSRRLGLAMRKRKDQIFETGEGFIQLKEVIPDSHRQKPQWKLTGIQSRDMSNKTAPSAPIAPSSNTYIEEEKIIPKIYHGSEEINILPHIEGAAEHSAQGALGAGSESFIFEDDTEERVAIQDE
ncbi:hypothetical protein FACS1894216_05130 [Synergistales bacterium]|nr:hypothetical protein FACS1894216_05130 [Synergistales bacterium]